jgi:hypothetical protein
MFQRCLLTILLLLLASCRAGTVTPHNNVAAQPAGGRSPVRSLTEINLAEIGALAPKGRVQDAEYNRSPVVEELLAHGKESIPYLISKLDDETKINTHVVDYWYEVHIGDVALIVLSDFFTDRGWQKTTIPAVGWYQFLERGNDRSLTSEQVLRAGPAQLHRQAWPTQHQDQMAAHLGNTSKPNLLG